MKPYIVTFDGEQPEELNAIITYRPQFSSIYVFVETDKSAEELMKIKGVVNVERADTGKLCV